jgi:hypothetical protein
MKIKQIIDENAELIERPIGRLARTGYKIGSKLGFQTSKAKLAVADDANEIKKNLQAWMAGSGIKKGELLVKNLKSFLNQVGLPTDQVDNLLSQLRQNPDGSFRTGSMTDKEVDTVIHKVVQLAFSHQGASGTKSRYAQRTPPSSGGLNLPNSLTNAINNLSPAQKAALKSML